MGAVSPWQSVPCNHLPEMRAAPFYFVETPMQLSCYTWWFPSGINSGMWGFLTLSSDLLEGTFFILKGILFVVFLRRIHKFCFQLLTVLTALIMWVIAVWALPDSAVWAGWGRGKERADFQFYQIPLEFVIIGPAFDCPKSSTLGSLCCLFPVLKSDH